MNKKILSKSEQETERELLDAYRELVKLQLDEIDNLETMIY